MLVHLLSKVCICSGKGGGLFFGAGLKTIFFGRGGWRAKKKKLEGGGDFSFGVGREMIILLDKIIILFWGVGGGQTLFFSFGVVNFFPSLP